MSLLLLFRPLAGTYVPPDPVAPTKGVPGGRMRRPRIAVRIAGRMYVGEYAEVSRLVATMAAQDAAEVVAQSDEPVARNTRDAKRTARKAAAQFNALMQVTDVTLPSGFEGIDPAPIAQRDLRAEYLRAYAAAMLAVERAANAQAFAAQQAAADEAQRVWQEQEDDDLDAINRALEHV